MHRPALYGLLWVTSIGSFLRASSDHASFTTSLEASNSTSSICSSTSPPSGSLRATTSSYLVTTTSTKSSRSTTDSSISSSSSSISSYILSAEDSSSLSSSIMTSSPLSLSTRSANATETSLSEGSSLLSSSTRSPNASKTPSSSSSNETDSAIASSPSLSLNSTASPSFTSTGSTITSAPSLTANSSTLSSNYTSNAGFTTSNSPNSTAAISIPDFTPTNWAASYLRSPQCTSDLLSHYNITALPTDPNQEYTWVEESRTVVTTTIKPTKYNVRTLTLSGPYSTVYTDHNAGATNGPRAGCCGVCTVDPYYVDVYYWQQPGANTECLSQNLNFVPKTRPIPSRSIANTGNIPIPYPTISARALEPREDSRMKNGSGPAYHVGTDGFTFVSPSIYLVFETIYASDNCGYVGGEYTSITWSYAPEQLSTLDHQGYVRPFNFTDLPCRPESIYHHDGYYHPPTLAAVPQLTMLDPTWKNCWVPYWADLDPPIALSSVGHLAAPTDPADSPAPAQTAEPQSSLPDQPAQTAAPESPAGSPHDPTQTQENPGSNPPKSSTPQGPHSQVPPSQSQPQDPSQDPSSQSPPHEPPNDPQHDSSYPQPQRSPNQDPSKDPASQSPPSTSFPDGSPDAPTPGSDSSVPVFHLHSEMPPATPAPGVSPNGQGDSSPLPSYPTLTAITQGDTFGPVVMGSHVVRSSGSSIIVGTNTLAPGATTTISHTPISVADNGHTVVVGSSTLALPTAHASLFSVAGHTVSSQNGALVVEGQTLTPGGSPAMIHGTYFSLASSSADLVVGTQTFVLPSNPTSGGSARLPAPTTVGGGGGGVLIIGSSTISLGAGAGAGSATSAVDGVIVDGTTVLPGQATTVLGDAGSQPVSIASDGSLFVVDGEKISVAPGGVVVDGTTLLRGGTMTANDGTVVSLGADGAELVVGTDTAEIMMLPASATATATTMTTTATAKATSTPVDIGGWILTAFLGIPLASSPTTTTLALASMPVGGSGSSDGKGGAGSGAVTTFSNPDVLSGNAHLEVPLRTFLLSFALSLLIALSWH